MKNLLLSLIVCFSLCFAGCFHLIEDITIKKDGSGTAKTIIDMQQMMGMLSMFMPDSLAGSFDMDSILRADIPRYEGMRGISNVDVEKQDEYVYALTMDFKDMRALNKAMGTGSGENPFGSMASEYSKKRKKFMRSTNMDGGFGLDDMEEDMGSMKEMMGMMNSPTYKVVYHFPSKVKKAKIADKNAKVEKDGNTISIEYDFLEFMEKEGIMMDHRIKY